MPVSETVPGCPGAPTPNCEKSIFFLDRWVSPELQSAIMSFLIILLLLALPAYRGVRAMQTRTGPCAPGWRNTKVRSVFRSEGSKTVSDKEVVAESDVPRR